MLPIVPEAEPQGGGRMDDQTAAGGNTAKTATVLVVDDDPQTAELVRAATSDPLVCVCSARSAAEAREFLSERDHALIILNVVLPDADGRNILSELRQEPETAAVPIFVVFGFWGPQPRDECLRLGANEVIEKPLEPDQLSRKISRALAGLKANARDPRSDPVTGLPNRVALAEAYDREAARAKRADRELTIALLDVDRLSGINEAHGRAVGDLVLKHVGSTLTAALRGTDVVSRWEEDEYVILFPNTDLPTAVRALTKCRAAIASSPLAVAGGATVGVSFTAGITTVVADAPLNEAVARADGMLLRAKTEAPSRIFSSDDDAPATKATLLVAEDDRVAAALVRHRLERAGFDVVHRDNGAEALAVALGSYVSLFVLDIRMPGMDGIELLKRLRESRQYADTPILMLTSMGREEDIVRAFKLGASDYLTKPFSPVELLARVQRLLRRGGKTA